MKKIIALFILLNSISLNLIASEKPTVKVIPKVNQQSEEHQEYIVNFTNFPKDQMIIVRSSRLLIPDFDIINILKFDDEGLSEIDNKKNNTFVLTSKGYAKGETRKLRFEFSHGEVISECEWIPKPFIVHSNQKTFSCEAKLVMLNPTSYNIWFKGLNQGENIHMISKSKHEELISDFECPGSVFFMNYMPGVLGFDGGKANLKFIRKNGDSLTIILPWKKEIILQTLQPYERVKYREIL